MDQGLVGALEDLQAFVVGQHDQLVTVLAGEPGHVEDVGPAGQVDALAQPIGAVLLDHDVHAGGEQLDGVPALAHQRGLVGRRQVDDAGEVGAALGHFRELVAAEAVEIGIGAVALFFEGSHHQILGAVAVEVDGTHGEVQVAAGDGDLAQLAQTAVVAPLVDDQAMVVQDSDLVAAVTVEVGHGHVHHLVLEALAADAGTVSGVALVAELGVQVGTLLAGLVADDVRTAATAGGGSAGHAQHLGREGAGKALHGGVQAAHGALGRAAPGGALLVHTVEDDGAVIAHDAHRAPQGIVGTADELAGFGGGTGRTGPHGARGACGVKTAHQRGRHSLGQVAVVLGRVHLKRQQHERLCLGSLGLEAHHQHQAGGKRQLHGKFHSKSPCSSLRTSTALAKEGSPGRRICRCRGGDRTACGTGTIATLGLPRNLKAVSAVTARACALSGILRQALLLPPDGTDKKGP